MRRSTVMSATGATAGWGIALADAIGLIHLTLAQSQLALGAGMTLTAGIMLCVRRRPLGAAYDLGYEEGRRDAMRGPGGGRVLQLHKRDLEPREEAV